MAQDTDNIKKLSSQYVAILEQNGFPVTEAFLFGSCVKGTPRHGSDIDVAIVTPEMFSDNWDERTRARCLAWGVDQRLEVVIFPPERFKDWHPLVHEIKTTGIRIR